MQELLLTYGPLGMWTAMLLYERYRFNNRMEKTVTNNTVALTKVQEVIQKCKK